MPNDIPPSSYYRDKFQSLIELLIKTGLWCAFQSRDTANAFVDRLVLQQLSQYIPARLWRS